MVTGAASRGGGAAADRRARGRAGAVAPPRLPAAPAGRQPGRGAGQQDGPGRLLAPTASAQVAEEYRAYLRGLGVDARLHHPDLGARRRQHRRPHARACPGTRARPCCRRWTASSTPSAPAERPLRLPVQDVYKFDQRRIIAGRVEIGHARGRRRGGVLAVQQDRARSRRSRPGTAATRRRGVRPAQSIGVTLDRADLRRARRGDEPSRGRADREQRVQGAAVLARPQAADGRQELHAEARHGRGAGHGRGDRARHRHLRPVDQGCRADRAQRRRRGRAAHQAHAARSTSTSRTRSPAGSSWSRTTCRWAAASSRWTATPTSAS